MSPPTGAWSARSCHSGPWPRVIKPGRAAARRTGRRGTGDRGVLLIRVRVRVERERRRCTSIPMATSIATPQDNWAVLPVSSGPAFWQVFVRPAGSASWRLATPPGVADNGGLVVSAGAATSLTVAVRPSEHLMFSPLAQTADGGTSWSAAGPIGAPVAASPDALAADGGRLVALLSAGTIETSSDGGDLVRSCQARRHRGVRRPEAMRRRGPGHLRLVRDYCRASARGRHLPGGRPTAMFSYSPGAGWRRADLPATGRLLRFGFGGALVRGKAGLTALFGASGWTGYAPLSGQASAGTAAGVERVGGPAVLGFGNRDGDATVWRRVGAAVRRAGRNDRRATAAVGAAAAGARAHHGARVWTRRCDGRARRVR